jgi:type IV secretion system protein TrbC
MSHSPEVFGFFRRYRRNSAGQKPSGGLAGIGHHISGFIWKGIAIAVPALLGLVSPAYAASTGAPWEAPLTKLLNSLTGPVAQIVGVAAVVVAGFGIAFSEGGGGLRKLVWVALGLSIAFAATTFFLPLFGFGGGLAF